jgi:hypothetical protein
MGKLRVTAPDGSELVLTGRAAEAAAAIFVEMARYQDDINRVLEVWTLEAHAGKEKLNVHFQAHRRPYHFNEKLTA